MRTFPQSPDVCLFVSFFCPFHLIAGWKVNQRTLILAANLDYANTGHLLGKVEEKSGRIFSLSGRQEAADSYQLWASYFQICM